MTTSSNSTSQDPRPSYAEINKSLWDTWAAVHIKSDFYELDNFLAGKDFLRDIELAALPEVAGKKLLHLQCHFGQDTLSWARRGAQVTGVDLSTTAIEKARELAEQLQLDATFYNCNLYDTPTALDGQFDIVFTSYGTIGWLPNLDKWAAVIRRCLKPGGTFFMVDWHPFVWMFDDETHSKITYGYFNDEMFVEDTTSSYAGDHADQPRQTATFNHPISEILNALINSGLSLDYFNEYNYSNYDIFPNSEQLGDNRFVMKHFGTKIPYMYAIKARK